MSGSLDAHFDRLLDRHLDAESEGEAVYQWARDQILLMLDGKEDDTNGYAKRYAVWRYDSGEWSDVIHDWLTLADTPEHRRKFAAETATWETSDHSTKTQDGWYAGFRDRPRRIR